MTISDIENSPTEFVRVLETEMCTYSFDTHGVLHIIPNKIEVTDELIESNYKQVKDFIGTRKVLMFVDSTQSLPIDKKQRLAFEKQSEEFCLALAFTSKSNLGHAVASIFIAMTRTKVPMKIFRKKSDALRWLYDLLR